MSPILARLTIGDAEYVLRAYSTFYTLAWVVAPVVGAWFAHRRGLPWRRVLAIYALALAAGVVGARVLDLFVAWRYYADDPARIWAASFAGYSLYGGLLIATGVGIVLARAWHVSIWRAADAAVPALVVGQVLMRTGCFLNGCCYGLPTDVPWGVTYPAGSPVWLAQFTQGAQGLVSSFAGVVNPVHPTQLYEVAGAVLFGLIALRMMRRPADGDTGHAAERPRRRIADGVPFLVYALGFTLVRLGNHFLRARQPVVTAPEWFYPVFYLALAAVIAGVLVWRVREGRAGVSRTGTAGLGVHPAATAPLPAPAAGTAETDPRHIGTEVATTGSDGAPPERNAPWP